MVKSKGQGQGQAKQQRARLLPALTLFPTDSTKTGRSARFLRGKMKRQAASLTAKRGQPFSFARSETISALRRSSCPYPWPTAQRGRLHRTAVAEGERHACG
jgi:hypothetical protein